MYNRSITRNHRTAFLLLIDGSGSMAEPMKYNGRDTTKAEAVAQITNELLFELIERARRDDGVRDYYDIGVWRYSGDDELENLLSEHSPLISVVQLSERTPEYRTYLREYERPDGGITLREGREPEWIKPHAEGQTPMFGALCTARDILEEWCARRENIESFPPVIFNITDGEATDCDEEDIAEIACRIKALSTYDGNVLVVNIHIASSDTRESVFFPSEEEARYPNRYARLLYECSSPMPALFEPAIRAAKSVPSLPPYRGMSFNASAVDLVAMLNIGSISVKTE